MKMILRICILFLFLIPCLLKAQTQKFYTTDNGLSNSLINQIYQDRKGFVWVATEWGLNKYDSNKFTIYNHLSGDPTSLTDNYVRTLFEDSNGRFFIGLINGLMIYDARSDLFREIKMVGERNTIVHTHVTSLVELPNGDIIIATSGKGLFVLKKGANAATYFKIVSPKLKSKFIYTLFKDRDNNLWIALETGGLYYYNISTCKLDFISSENKLIGENVSALVEDNIGNVFVGTLTNGLFIYNKYRKSIVSVENSKNLLIKCLYLNSANELLIGTDGQGLKMYDYVENKIDTYKLNVFPYDVSTGKVHSIMEDHDKNLWLGLFQKGVVFISSTPNHFQYLGMKQNTGDPIGLGSVRSICKDRNGLLWVSVDNEGLYVVDGNGKMLRHYDQDASPNSVSNIILCIYEDRSGTLWTGSFTKGLCKIDKNTGACQYVPELKGQRVYCITEDQFGNILAGTYGAGFYRINPKTNECEQFVSSKKENDEYGVNELANDWINVLLCDRDGIIWIGHHKGLSCYDPKRKSFINYFGRNNILPNTVVVSLMEDKEGKLWVGTSDGLLTFDKKSKKIEKFTTKDNLPNNLICGIKEDTDGYVWISTYHGLSKFDPRSKKFVNYYVDDGIQGYEFTWGASFKDKNGIIYFGGTNGLTFFDPLSIISEQRTLNLLLTDFYIGNHRVNFNREASQNITDKAISETTVFKLSDQENSFGMSLSSMDYANSDRIVYQYILEGWNKEWLSTSPGVSRINFSNLPSGKYILKVKAVDNNAESREETFVIQIAYPWYATWWAYLIYAVLILMILAGIYKYYWDKLQYKKEMEEQEREQVANESRLQYFINISHEIRSPMSLIVSPLEKLMASNKNDEIQKTYLIMLRNANRILRLVNQLMDVRKLDKGQMHLKWRKTDMVGFIKDLMLTFDYLSKKKNITFDFKYDEEPLFVWVDLNNFDKVLLNLFSNAFKFTPNGGRVDVELSVGYDANSAFPLDNYFQITVSDTGIGISAEHIEKIFDRFYLIDPDGQSSIGTGVGLHLARQLVNMHAGVIHAENRQDVQGSRFVIRLPLGYSHLKKEQIEKQAFSEINQKHTDRLLEVENVLANRDEGVSKVKSTKSKTNYTILIVEDDEEIRSYLSMELSFMYKVIESNNGKVGYETILAKHPDLVISDVVMPEMDGITLCKKVKQNVNINHIPIILLTAKSDTEDRNQGLDIGADAYLFKPFHLTDLVHQINNIIRNRELLKVKYAGFQNHKDMIPDIQLKSSDEVLLEKVMKTIQNNISSPELNVEMLAETVGMSRVHMHRKLKELMNTSARDLIRSIRLKQAATLLKSKKLAISEVAYATGFTNLSHFSTVFREFYGISPSDYVASHAEEQPEPPLSKEE